MPSCVRVYIVVLPSRWSAASTTASVGRPTTFDRRPTFPRDHSSFSYSLWSVATSWVTTSHNPSIRFLLLLSYTWTRKTFLGPTHDTMVARPCRVCFSVVPDSVVQPSSETHSTWPVPSLDAGDSKVMRPRSMPDTRNRHQLSTETLDEHILPECIKKMMLHGRVRWTMDTPSRTHHFCVYTRL